MSLKDILGQEQALEILTGCITKNHIAHAYFFAGEDGIGKKLTAINFAKLLNCQNNRDASRVARNETDCCDECPSCIKTDKAIHPDVFFVAPEDGMIKVDVIRQLEESLSYKAFEGGSKIAIIDEANTLNQSAANAFLKTLEEPPDQSILVLISSMPELIPLTIRSRCLKINFSPLPLNKMEEFLRQKQHAEDTEIDMERAKLLGLLSGGRPGWALSKNLIERRDRSFDDFISLLGRVKEGLWEDRDSMEEWFDWAQLWLRDIAVFRATGRGELLINHDMGKEIKNISKKAELRDILELSNALCSIRDLLRFNLNIQLTLYHTHLLLKKTFAGSS